MPKLTDTQLIVLSKAAASEDGAAVLPERMTKAAAAKVGSSLVARKLMREIRAKPGMAIWREDETGRGLSLVLTRDGRDAIGVVKDDERAEEHKAVASSSKTRGRAAANTVASRAARQAAEGSLVASVGVEAGCSLPREGSKQALIITILQKSKGASLDALMEATGWLPHTTRAAMTSLRKRGFTIEFTKEAAGSVYRIVDQAKVAA